MSEDYVEWDVHATNDALTPRVEYDDPLSQFSESEVSVIDGKIHDIAYTQR